MKKLLALAIIFAMMFALAVPASAISATVHMGTPVIDGTLDEGVYSGPFAIASVHQNADGTLSTNPATGNAWIAWDSSALYFYIEVADKSPNHDDESPDAVEIYIDWNNAKGAGVGAALVQNDEGGWGTDEPGTAEGYPYWQVRVRAGAESTNDVSGAYWEGMGWGEVVWDPDSAGADITVVSNIVSGGYVIEVKIAPPEGVTLSAGKTIGFDFQIEDNINGEGSRDGQTWMTASQHNDQQWQTPMAVQGLMTLDGAPLPADEPEPDEPAADEPAADAGAGDGGAGGDAGAGATVARTPSPRTNDAGIIALIALMAIAAAGIVVLRRKSVR